MSRTKQNAMVLGIFCGLLMMLAGRGGMASDIPFEYEELERQRVYSETQLDFESWSDLKNAANRFLREFKCPQCNGHQCRGEHLSFLVRKVDVYREVEKPGLLWGTKKVDEFVRTAWRIETFGLRKRDGGLGILSDEREGRIWCGRRDCGWEIRGGTKTEQEGGVRWRSINDLLQGRF